MSKRTIVRLLGGDKGVLMWRKSLIALVIVVIADLALAFYFRDVLTSQYPDKYAPHYEGEFFYSIFIEIFFAPFVYVWRWVIHHPEPITAFATIAIGWYTYALVQATKELTRLADHQEKATHTVERAYVKMSHTEPGINWFDAENCTFTVRMEIKNWGHTPAKVTDILLRPLLLQNGEPLPVDPPYERKREQTAFHAFLVKDDYFYYMNPELFDAGAGNFKDIVDGTKKLYVLGYVDYIDKFLVRHRAGYARVLNPQARILHGKGNNLDFVTQAGYNYDRPRKKDEGNDWSEEPQS